MATRTFTYTVTVEVVPCDRCGTEDKAARERVCDDCEDWYDKNDHQQCDLCGGYVLRADISVYSAFHDACPTCMGQAKL